MSGEIYDVNDYTDENLYEILNLTNPTDRELEAKILQMIKKYENMNTESSDNLVDFFEQIYEHFFQEEDDEENNIDEEEEINYDAETKEEKDPEPTLEPEEETKEEVQEKAEQAALDADWLYFKHYPWVYSSKTGSWYYLVTRNEGMIVWSQLSNKWQMISEAFGVN